MNAKSIELQTEANNREAAHIQQQLSQIASNNPLRQSLLNRLEMINKAQVYWANEYFKLKGTQLNTNSAPNAVPSFPTNVPMPKVPNSPKEDSRAEWNTIRENIRKSMVGNPNYLQIESYLNQLEKTYGDQIPKHSGGIVFGKGSVLHGLSKTPTQFNGTLVENTALYFDEEGSAIIFLNGSTIKPTALTMVIIKSPKEDKVIFIPMVNDSKEIREMLKILRGD